MKFYPSPVLMSFNVLMSVASAGPRRAAPGNGPAEDSPDSSASGASGDASGR